jgi:uncharacterized iron-regulated protein
MERIPRRIDGWERLLGHSRLARVFILFVGIIIAALPGASAHAAIEARPGLIWDVAAGAPISRSVLDQRIAATTFVLLGEKHNNPHHHRLQAEILTRLLESGRRPTLVWEMLPRARQPRIDAYLKRDDADADGFASAIGWSDLGWGDWSLFRPVAEVALAGRAPQRAGGLDRADLKAIGRDGMTALPTDLAARLPDGALLSPEKKRVIEDAVFDGHCGYVPQAHLGPMISVQIARDLSLADALSLSTEPDGAVLIAGSHHVRRDAGAPVHLARMRPDASMLAIRFVETVAGENVTGHLDLDERGKTVAHDILWFTQPGPDKDYCADLAKRFGLKDKPANKSGATFD